MNVEYTTQISAEIEGIGTTAISHDFSKTQNRILRALSNFPELCLNSYVLAQSGNIPD